VHAKVLNPQEINNPDHASTAGLELN